MLGRLPSHADPRVLVGPGTLDDAGAYRLTDELVLLQTADVISPVCDDPYRYGQVAAANSLSDVYAMGGAPRTALNLAFFPRDIPVDVIAGILRGAGDVCLSAGAAVIGGHTVHDEDTKFGLAVAGTCRPEQLLRNAGARAGDRIVLTKPVGTGLMMSSNGKGWLDDAEMAGCLDRMAELNDVAAELALAHGAHAATDVTGFGLAGHASEMARASGARIVLDFDAIPAYPRWRELARRGARTGITADNQALMQRFLHRPVDEGLWPLLTDPQTSGGLLVALPEQDARSYVGALRERGNDVAAIVGEVVRGDPAIEIR